MSRLQKEYNILWALMVPSVLFSFLLLIINLDESGNYISPKIWVYDPEQDVIVFTREVKEDVMAEYTHEIITIDGLECSVSGRTFYGKTEGVKTITFPVPETLRPCLQAGEYKHTMAWQVIRWAGFRLKPITLAFTRLEEKIDLQQYRYNR